MGKALLISVHTSVANANFSPCANTGDANDTSEASNQFTTRVAGTLSLLAVGVNATGSSRVVRVRKNGANGNQSVSPTNTTAGVYADTTNSDSLASTDNFTISYASSGTPTYYFTRVVFTATTNHATFFCQTGTNAYNSSTTFYSNCVGVNINPATEGLAKLRISSAGTAKSFNSYLLTNTLGGGAAATLQSRLNGSNGNLLITYTNGVAGLYEDTTHTDTLAVGDDYCFVRTITAGSGNIAPKATGFAVENTTGSTNDVFAATGSSSGTTRSASASNTYYPIAGSIHSGSTTEANNTIQHGFAATVTRLRCLVTSNSYSAAGTLKSRKAGADGNLTVSITAGVTGVYEDTTHSDSVAATDNYCAAIVGGTSGSITLFWIGATEQEQSNDTNVAITGNAATGSPGSLAPSAASGLTGNSGTGGLGALAVAVSIALTGVSGTGSVGNLSPTASVALSGNEATGSPGSLTSSSVQSVAITGNTGTGSPGTLSPAASFALSGNQATGAVGSLTSSSVQSVALTGNAGTGAVGSLSVDASFALTGNAATGQVGSLTSSSVQSVALTGNAATGGVGSLTPSLSLALTGNSATGSPGTLVPSAGGSIALTGVSGTGAVGDLASSMVVSKAITGNAATGAVGSLGKTFSIALTGNAGTGSPGTLTPLTGTVVALTGVFGTGAVGDLGAYAAPVLRFIPQIQNLSQTQAQINAILAVIYGAMPGYGDALPAVTGQVDGRLFTLTTTNKLYQLQAGFWVALT